MIAVYKRELKSYFSNMSGYIFIALILAVCGFFSSIYNFEYGSPSFENALYGASFIFLLAVPVLTMRCFAEERQFKTDQLLYSLPLKMSQVVIGKYLAMLTVYAVPTAVMCFYPLILSMFGTVSFVTTYSVIVAFFFLGAALIAIGMFVSTLTESQAISAVLSFGALLVVYLMSDIAAKVPDTASGSAGIIAVLIVALAVLVYILTKSFWAALVVGVVGESALLTVYILDSSVFESSVSSALNSLSLFSRFYPYLYGIFDLGGIVYFISIIFVFNFFSVQSLEKRRWS
ncbi:MAG: ABC transporter permease [Clostridia bacterium]|nr:ABC transporter permease [Clostridia bacterium]